jgi:hypothetical protein
MRAHGYLGCLHAWHIYVSPALSVCACFNRTRCHTRTRTRARARTHTHKHVRQPDECCMFPYLFPKLNSFECVCVCVCVWIHVCAYICTGAKNRDRCTNTHTHTCAPSHGKGVRWQARPHAPSARRASTQMLVRRECVCCAAPLFPHSLACEILTRAFNTLTGWYTVPLLDANYSNAGASRVCLLRCPPFPALLNM